MFLVLQNPCVVLFDKIFHIFHSTIAALYCVSIEYLAETMIPREMCTNEIKEFFAYVCPNI